MWPGPHLVCSLPCTDPLPQPTSPSLSLALPLCPYVCLPSASSSIVHSWCDFIHSPGLSLAGVPFLLSPQPHGLGGFLWRGLLLLHVSPPRTAAGPLHFCSGPSSSSTGLSTCKAFQERLFLRGCRVSHHAPCDIATDRGGQCINATEMGKLWFFTHAWVNLLNGVFPNVFQEALCRTVPGDCGRGHLQRLPTPGRGAAAEPVSCLRQAVTEGRARGPAPGEGGTSDCST